MKKYIVLNTFSGDAYIVPNMTAVSIILGVDRKTVGRWMEKRSVYVYQTWVICYGYKEIVRKDKRKHKGTGNLG